MRGERGHEKERNQTKKKKRERGEAHIPFARVELIKVVGWK